MFETFAVPPRTRGLVASFQADQMAADPGDGSDAAGAADGSQPLDDDAPLDAEGADAGGEPEQRTDADDDDDEEFDTDDEPGADVTERYKKVSAALKKAKRKLANTRAGRQFLNSLKQRGVSPEDLYADSRELRDIKAALQRNPKLRAALNGDAEPPPADRPHGTDRRAEKDQRDEFTFDEDPDVLGFDPAASRTNRTLANGLKAVARLQHEFKQFRESFDPRQLTERVDQIDRGVKQTQQSTLQREWTGALQEASAHIKDPDQKAIFGDLMRAAYRERGGQQPAKFFVDFYLKKLKVNPAQAARANAAVAQGKQRTAERVAGLPRQTGQNSTPAPARQKRELLNDVHKRLRTIGSH